MRLSNCGIKFYQIPSELITLQCSFYSSGLSGCREGARHSMCEYAQRPFSLVEQGEFSGLVLADGFPLNEKKRRILYRVVSSYREAKKS